MTTINIDIRTMGATTHPDDRVILWAPEVRARISGGLVSTAIFTQPLSDGQATITNFEPGPVLVRFECLGIADTAETLGIVPDSGVWGIEEIISGKLTWTPPVVSAAQQLIIDQMNASIATIEATVATAVASEVAAPAASASSSASQAASSATAAGLAANEAASSASDAHQAAMTAAQEAAQLAALDVMGIFITETPAQSGLYEIGGDITLTETPAQSGLYTIGAV